MHLGFWGAAPAACGFCCHSSTSHRKIERAKDIRSAARGCPLSKIVPHCGTKFYLHFQAAVRLEKHFYIIISPRAICKEELREAFGFYVNLGCSLQKCFVPNMLIRFTAETGMLEASLARRSIKCHLPSSLEDLSLPK